jgi:DNA-binding NtrC family response regulator
MPEIKRILMVDDDDFACNVLSTMLCQLGFDDVVITKSGKQALDILKENHFDIVFTDLRLTDMTCIELLKKIKKFDPNIGTFICTAYGDIDSYLEAMNLGVIEYLNRPINPNKLKKAINGFLDKKRAEKY